MIRYILKRTLQILPLVIIISIIGFLMIQLAPYDAIDSITTPGMTQEYIDALRKEYGLDQPVPLQYVYWLKGIVTGQMGHSIVTHIPISEELSVRIPATFILMGPALLISFVLAIVLGMYTAAHKGSLIDRFFSNLCSFSLAVPSFWFALMIIYFLGHKLKLFPILGMYSSEGAKDLPDLLRHMVMPVITLVFSLFPDTYRHVRGSTITQLSENYVTVQKAFGSSKLQTMFRHVFKNILLPVVTILGMSLPLLVTGAFVTESLFSWPGIGSYFLIAIRSFDYPVIMVILVLSSTLVILGNLLSDILYFFIDPRIRGTKG